MRPYRAAPLLVAAVIGLAMYFVGLRDAQAVPSFARKYQTSCQTCHTVYPVLNPFGEAFRRDGYRFPSWNGSEDSDAVKAPMIALGQEEYEKTFPDSVWPDKIPEAVPLSVMVNGSLPVNMPGSEAKDAAGNVFTWSGIEAEFHLFGAGAFNDTLTYMTQLTLESNAGSPPGTFDIETAYLLWNDIVGPRHLLNLWVGRLWAPQLTSFGLHSSYLNDTVMPAVSVAGLYNPSASLTLGQGHNDGAELNGIVAHRFDYAVGWVASSNATGLTLPNAEDVYAHIGVKSGGVALDGEGKYGPNVPDPRKPWAEKSITIDLFAYHGLERLDNGTGTMAGGGATPVQQDDSFDALGAVVHGQLDSLSIMLGRSARTTQAAIPRRGRDDRGRHDGRRRTGPHERDFDGRVRRDRLRHLALVRAGRTSRVHAHDPRVVEQLRRLDGGEPPPRHPGDCDARAAQHQGRPDGRPRARVRPSGGRVLDSGRGLRRRAGRGAGEQA